MKNGKVTGKAKRVKQIEVSFDLNEVPEEQLGEQALYLVIKDAQKKLLDQNAPTVKVRKKGLLQEIRVIATNKINLEKGKEFSFNLRLWKN